MGSGNSGMNGVCALSPVETVQDPETVRVSVLSTTDRTAVGAAWSGTGATTSTVQVDTLHCQNTRVTLCEDAALIVSNSLCQAYMIMSPYLRP